MGADYFELDVTETLVRQIASGIWDGVKPLALTIRPLRGRARDDAGLQIGRIEFHTQ